MESPLKKLDAVMLDQVDAAVLRGDAARPDIPAQIFQRLRFADTREGLS